MIASQSLPILGSLCVFLILEFWVCGPDVEVCESTEIQLIRLDSPFCFVVAIVSIHKPLSPNFDWNVEVDDQRSISVFGTDLRDTGWRHDEHVMTIPLVDRSAIEPTIELHIFVEVVRRDQLFEFLPSDKMVIHSGLFVGSWRPRGVRDAANKSLRFELLTEIVLSTPSLTY